MVRDTGVGIREEDRARIFLPLSKMESTRVSSITGVGIGLSTCKSIVEALKGSIHLNDEVTQYDSNGVDFVTSFAFLIPCAELEEISEHSISLS